MHAKKWQAVADTGNIVGVHCGSQNSKAFDDTELEGLVFNHYNSGVVMTSYLPRDLCCKMQNDDKSSQVQSNQFVKKRVNLRHLRKSLSLVALKQHNDPDIHTGLSLSYLYL